MRKLTAQVNVRTDDGKVHSIAFHEGEIVAASSPLPNDSVTRVALTSHFVSPMQVGEITRRLAAESHRDEVDVLAETSRLSPAQIMTLRRRVVIQRAARTFAIDRAQFDIDNEITLAVLPNFTLPLGLAIFQGVRMNLSEQRLTEDFREMGTVYKMHDGVTDEDISRFEFEGHTVGFVDALRRGTTLAELEATFRDIEPRTLHAMIYSLICGALCDATGGHAVDRTAPPLPRTSSGVVSHATIKTEAPIVTRARTTAVPANVAQQPPSGSRPGFQTQNASQSRGDVDKPASSSQPIPRAASSSQPGVPKPASSSQPGIAASRTVSQNDFPMRDPTQRTPTSKIPTIPSRTQTPTLTPRTQSPTASPTRPGSQTGLPPTRAGSSTGIPVSRPGTQTSSPLDEFMRETSTGPGVDEFKRESTTNRGIVLPATPRTITAPRTITERDRAKRDIETVIATRLAKLEPPADHFTMLGLPLEAPIDAVRAAYVDLSRKLHPESLIQVGIEDEKSAQRVLAQVNLAFQTLTDSQKRREYTSALQRGDATPLAPRARQGEMNPKELAAEAYQRGEGYLKREDVTRAVEELGRAVHLQPANLEYTSMFAWAMFCAAADKKAIYTDTRRALEKAIHRLENPTPARFYLGRVERMIGHDREALNHFELVLLEEPNHREAQSEVRVLHQRLAKGTKPKR